MTDNTQEQNPMLNPLYQPAEFDSRLTIIFIGNTPVISGYEAHGITPYHMLAATEDLKRKAFQMIQAAEIAEAKERKRREEMGIQTATKMEDVPRPPGRFVVGG